MAKKILTRAQRAIVKAPLTELRRVTLAERIANPGRFSLKGEYLVKKSIEKVGARTAFTTVSLRRDAQIGVSHGKAAKLRVEGKLGYGPKAEERAIPKSVETFRLRRKIAKIEEAEKPPTPWARRRKHRPARKYPVTDEIRSEYWELRRRKLNGEFLGDEWFQFIDLARAANDPMLSVLMKS